jgi:hypothetical protein
MCDSFHYPCYSILYGKQIKKELVIEPLYLFLLCLLFGCAEVVQYGLIMLLVQQDADDVHGAECW